MLIVVEGIDCSGKTTLVKEMQYAIKKFPEIINYFKNEIIFTYEPGGCELIFGQKIRKFIFENKTHISPITESLLFFACRSEHVEKILKKSQNQKTLIICDRFFLSTLAYQGYCGNVSPDWLFENMKFIGKGIKTNATFFLDVCEKDYLIFRNKKIKEKKINSFDCEHKFLEMQNSYQEAINFLKDKGEKIIKLNAAEKEKNILTIFEYIKKCINDE